MTSGGSNNSSLPVNDRAPGWDVAVVRAALNSLSLDSSLDDLLMVADEINGRGDVETTIHTSRELCRCTIRWGNTGAPWQLNRGDALAWRLTRTLKFGNSIHIVMPIGEIHWAGDDGRHWDEWTYDLLYCIHRRRFMACARPGGEMVIWDNEYRDTSRTFPATTTTVTVAALHGFLEQAGAFFQQGGVFLGVLSQDRPHESHAWHFGGRLLAEDEDGIILDIGEARTILYNGGAARTEPHRVVGTAGSENGVLVVHPSD